MKLRGDVRISKTKAIPFVIIAIALILFGIILTCSGLMIEYKWKYDISIFYTPYWVGVLLLLAGLSIFLFVWVRKPSVAVFVSTISLPALAACIIEFILCGLMAWALFPTDSKYFCSATGATTTIVCACAEHISFTIAVKGTEETVSALGRSNSCENEVKFMYELMLATACCCFVLAIVLFWFIIWVYCAVTRTTYMERRKSYRSPDQGSVYHRATIQRDGLVITNNNTLNHNMQAPADDNTFNRSGSFDAQYNKPVIPHVTVYRSTSQPARSHSRTGTLKSTRAPGPPSMDRRATSPALKVAPPPAALDRRTTSPALVPYDIDIGPPPSHTVPRPQEASPTFQKQLPDIIPSEDEAEEEEEEKLSTSSEDNTEVTKSTRYDRKASAGVSDKVMNFERKVSNLRN